MSDIFDGGPAFPRDHASDGHNGMTLRDYFIAHAPAKPQPWFQPVMPPCPVKPEMPRAGDDGDRAYVREFDLVMDPEEVQDPELRAYVVALQAYQPLATAWRQEAEKQRYVQWPAAWADAMLEARAVPQSQQYRELQPYDQRRIDAAERLANLVNAAKSMPGYLELPIRQRDAIQEAVDDVLDPEITF